MRRLALLAVWLALPVAGASAQPDRWGEYINPITTPTAVAGVENVTRVQSGNSSGMVLESNGTVHDFGHGEKGQMGNGKEVGSETAVEAKFPETVAIVTIGEGEGADFAIDSTGRLWGWGSGADDLLCGKPSSDVPQLLGVSEAAEVKGGAHHVLVRLTDGKVLGCGEDKYGQLGFPKGSKDIETPTEIPGLSGIVQVTAGDLSSCVLTATGKVYCMGLNNHGQDGSGKATKELFVPTEVKLPGPASYISEGGDRSEDGSGLALVEGIVYAWGTDTCGQLGDDATTNRLAPVVASELAGYGITQAVEGGAEMVAVNEAGNVYTLGCGEGYALGNGSEANSFGPLLTDGGRVEVSATAKEALDR